MTASVRHREKTPAYTCGQAQSVKGSLYLYVKLIKDASSNFNSTAPASLSSACVRTREKMVNEVLIADHR